MIILANEAMQMADELEARLQVEQPDVTVVWVDDAGQPLGPAGDAEVLYRFQMSAAALAAVLRAAPRLRWVHTGSAGVDTILPVVVAHGPPGVVLTRSRGPMSRPIAEFALGQMLLAAKGFPAFFRDQARHEWRHGAPPPARDLRGARTLIFGLGSIGQEIATLAAAVGMRVWGVRRRAPAANETLPPGVERVLGMDDDWRALLPAMDFVAIAAPLTDATRGAFGAPEFAAMRPDAWIVNISRGAIVAEPDLITALHTGSIGGAALDVTPTEPLPAASPLWDFPNCVITPHVSWRSPGLDAAALDLFMANLRRFRAGEPLLNVVAPEFGY